MLLNVIGILFCLALSFMWIDYLRRIDVFERERPLFVLTVFILGMLAPLIIDPVYKYINDPLQFGLTGVFYNDLLFSFFGIGLLEEIVKFIPFLFMILFFRKELNEPLDYIIFACVSSLGFSFHENIIYFQRYGFEVIASRSVLSVPSHMFDSSLFVYGLVLLRFRKDGNQTWKPIWFMFLAVFSHAFYDFWLISEIKGGFVITVFYFFLLISAFCKILNNCMNNSPFYSHKKFIDSQQISRVMFYYYGIVILLVFVLTGISEKGEEEDQIKKAFIEAFRFVLMDLFIMMVLILRLSRFKLIPSQWKPVRLELPFHLSFFGGTLSPVTSIVQSTRPYQNFFRVQIKGDHYNETYLTKFMEGRCIMKPLMRKNSYLIKGLEGVLSDKVFLKNEEVIYVFTQSESGMLHHYYLKAKINAKTRIQGKYPIAALMHLKKDKLENFETEPADFSFIEWVCIVPLEEKFLS